MKTITTLAAVALLSGCIDPDSFDALEADGNEDLGANPIEDDAGDEDLAPDLALDLDLDGASAGGEALAASLLSCPDARLIGILNPSEEDCGGHEVLSSPKGMWIGELMFDEGSDEIDGLLAAGHFAPGELRRYCMYEPPTGPRDLQDYQDLLDRITVAGIMPVSSIGVDCMGQGTQGTDLYAPVVREALQDAFFLNVDRVDGAGLGTTNGARARVDVGVIDTTSEAATLGLATPTNHHGLEMDGIISDLACPNGGACAVQTRHSMAMPRDDWATPPDWSGGGNHGTQGDLAMAVYAAVQSWHARKGGPDHSERLVLNLSLGWERDVADSIDETRGPMSSLVHALDYASCSGALIMVAAGNTPAPGCESEAQAQGPTLPAALEERAAPTATECAALGFPAVDTGGRPIFGGNAYRPLVYAVGGVDEYDQPLSNSRNGGQPRLVAVGANGVGGDPATAQALTGTSVSTAAASGAAALLWSYRPELRPSEVVEYLYDNGYPTGDFADFHSLPQTPAVRRLSVCTALTAACIGEDPALCPALGCASAPTPATDGNLGGFFAEVDDVLTDTDLAGTLRDHDLTGAGTSAASCGVSSWDSLTDPAPEVPICSHCSIDVPKGGTANDDVVSLEIEAIYKGQITGVTLYSYDSLRVATKYDLSDVVTDLNNGTVELVTATVDAPDTVSAVLEFTLLTNSQTHAIRVRSY